MSQQRVLCISAHALVLIVMEYFRRSEIDLIHVEGTNKQVKEASGSVADTREERQNVAHE